MKEVDLELDAEQKLIIRCFLNEDQYLEAE